MFVTTVAGVAKVVCRVPCTGSSLQYPPVLLHKVSVLVHTEVQFLDVSWVHGHRMSTSPGAQHENPV